MVSNLYIIYFTLAYLGIFLNYEIFKPFKQIKTKGDEDERN